MSRLLHVIAYTADLERSRAFYRDRVGLVPEHESPEWAEFPTGDTSFVLQAVSEDGMREVELCFAVEDLSEKIASLASRGVVFEGPVNELPIGRLVHLRDPEGNRLAIVQPRPRETAEPGDLALIALVNAHAFAETVSFYRDRLGLESTREEADWIEFDTGGTRLAVHQRRAAADHPPHASQRVVFGFELQDLDRAAEEMRARGLHFSTAPTTEAFGAYAEAFDPDGYLVVFREPIEEPALEEVLAAPFEDDDSPLVAAIRKPVKKSAPALSRVVSKPVYREKKTSAKAAKAKPAAGRKRTARAAGVSAKPASRTVRGKRVASPRGTGPAGSRQKPKKTRDTKRAKAKPATGRLKKAERRVLARKKRAVAGRSKARPVKKAAARHARKR